MKTLLVISISLTVVLGIISFYAPLVSILAVTLFFISCILFDALTNQGLALERTKKYIKIVVLFLSTLGFDLLGIYIYLGLLYFSGYLVYFGMHHNSLVFPILGVVLFVLSFFFIKAVISSLKGDTHWFKYYFKEIK